MSGEWLAEATLLERVEVMPGDDLVSPADVVLDRAFTLSAPPAAVWPWFVQLGRRRAGWYLPGRIEAVMPRARRALRRLDPALQALAVGDVIPDWGGRDASFTVDMLQPPTTLVHRDQRGRTSISWAITLTPVDRGGTRVHLRLRMAPVRRVRLAETLGGLVDALTIVGLRAGLRERVALDG